MDDVRRIEPAAHADLEHDRPDAAAGEVQQAHRRGDLEERRAGTGPASESSRSSRSTASRTSSTSATTSAGEAGLPSTVNRSSRRCRCGEQYSPVRTPEADSAAAIIAAVEPLPLVPATWMIGSPAWGSPSRLSSRRIRPSFSSAGIRGIPSHS